MFGRQKNKEEKSKNRLDRLVMGAIIGTAIGSVIGLSVAPKKGKDTRKAIKDTYQNRGENRDEIDEIKQLTKETVTGLGTLIKNFLFRKKKNDPPSAPRPHRNMKKIPMETEVENTFDAHQE